MQVQLKVCVCFELLILLLFFIFLNFFQVGNQILMDWIRNRLQSGFKEYVYNNATYLNIAGLMQN